MTVCTAPGQGMTLLVKRRVLLIEAHDPTLFLLAFILEREGCEILVARGHGDGLDLARRAHPHLVVIGRDVAGADRLEVARCLRNDGTLAHLPVVALAPLADDGAAAALAGCNGWVDTPIIPARLRAQLATFLESPGSEKPGLAACAGSGSASA